MCLTGVDIVSTPDWPFKVATECHGEDPEQRPRGIVPGWTRSIVDGESQQTEEESSSVEVERGRHGECPM